MGSPRASEEASVTIDAGLSALTSGLAHAVLGAVQSQLPRQSAAAAPNPSLLQWFAWCLILIGVGYTVGRHADWDAFAGMLSAAWGVGTAVLPILIVPKSEQEGWLYFGLGTLVMLALGWLGGRAHIMMNGADKERAKQEAVFREWHAEGRHKEQPHPQCPDCRTRA